MPEEICDHLRNGITYDDKNSSFSTLGKQPLLNTSFSSISTRFSECSYMKSYENMSALFTDMVSFTEMSSNMCVKQVVDILNPKFSKFDAMTASLELEKVKTIGMPILLLVTRRVIMPIALCN